jgi:hypothetical protein
MIGEKVGGASFLGGFRKAFGKTDIRWKTDIVLTIILLGAGYYVAAVMTAPPQTAYDILESIDFLLTNEMGMISITLVFMGTVMAYLTVENFIKIIILERAYGMVIRQEKDLFLAKAATLKDKIKELGKLVDEYTKEDFDISKEYDVYSSMKLERVDDLAKENNPQNRTVIEQQLVNVENAIGSLRERKRIADENWDRWKENIAKVLEEQGKVYAASLVTIPASLRPWVLNKYVKEASAEGVFFERDALRKRRLTPERLVEEMIEKGMLKGAVVLKQGKVAVAQFYEQKTLQTALALKLMAHLESLAKNLGQHSPQSFVSVGEKQVVVMLKDHTADAMLFIAKEKFKDAVEYWKSKTKVLDSDADSEAA